MKIRKEKLIWFSFGVATMMLFFYFYQQNNSTSEIEQFPLTLHNQKFIGGIPISSNLSNDAQCLDFIDFRAPFFMFGISDKGNWLLVTYRGRNSGWIPSSSNKFINEGSQTKPLLVAIEPTKLYIPQNNDKYIQAIQNITNNKEIMPYFVCTTYVLTPEYKVLVYIDSSGGVYKISDDTSQVVAFTNGYDTIKSQTNPSIPDEILEEYARNYLSNNSMNFEKYYNKLEINFIGRGDEHFGYYYTYTGNLYLPEAADGVNQKTIQVTFLSNGTIIGYRNELDLFIETQ